MSGAAFHPDLRGAARFLPHGVGRRWLVRLMRALPSPRPRMPPGITVEERPLPGTSAKVRLLRGPRAAGARPAILWIHGGGYVIGSAQQDDAMCARFATKLDAVVVSVDYRLAPDHPFPAPLDDCLAAFELLHRDAGALGIDPTRVVIAGQSAGGGLAAALTLRVHDRGLPAPALQLLVYPMLDDRTGLTPMDGTMHRVWDQKSNALGWSAYVGGARGSATLSDHAAPARRQSFAGLPPTWIGVGTCDLFHDEDVAYAERLRAAGVPTTLEIVDGAFHGFDTVLADKPVSRQFFAAQVQAIAAACGATSG